MKQVILRDNIGRGTYLLDYEFSPNGYQEIPRVGDKIVGRRKEGYDDITFDVVRVIWDRWGQANVYIIREAR